MRKQLKRVILASNLAWKIRSPNGAKNFEFEGGGRSILETIGPFSARKDYTGKAKYVKLLHV